MDRSKNPLEDITASRGSPFGIPNSEAKKIAAWRSLAGSVEHVSPNKPRRRRSSMILTSSGMHNRENSIVYPPSNPSPSTSAKLASKREKTKFPGVIHQTKERGSNTNDRKGKERTPSTHSITMGRRRSTKIGGEEAGIPAIPTNSAGGGIAAVRRRLSAATEDLAALRTAVAALKSNSIPSSVVSEQKKSLDVVKCAHIEVLSHRQLPLGQEMSTQNEPMSNKGSGYNHQAAKASDVVVNLETEHNTAINDHPASASNPKSGCMIENIEAELSFENTDTLHAEKTAPSVHSPSCTEYDGEDVVMGDATPMPISTFPNLEIQGKRRAAQEEGQSAEVNRQLQGQGTVHEAKASSREKYHHGEDEVEEDMLHQVSCGDYSELSTSRCRSSSNNAPASPSSCTTASASHSGMSNNPLYAGTPSNPTPPSVTMVRSMSNVLRRQSLTLGDTKTTTSFSSPSLLKTSDGMVQGALTPHEGFIVDLQNRSSASKTGIKLAEQLHAVAERLQTPPDRSLNQEKASSEELGYGGLALGSVDNAVDAGSIETASNLSLSMGPPQLEHHNVDVIASERPKPAAENSRGTPHVVVQKLKQDEDSKTNPVDGATVGDTTFQFKEDVAALLQALDANTPETVLKTGPNSVFSSKHRNGNALPCSPSAASTEERTKGQFRRRSSLSSGCDVPVLDLSKYDDDGEQRIHSGIKHMHARLLPPSGATHEKRCISPAYNETRAVSRTAVDSRPLGGHVQREVRDLRDRVEQLEIEREEAADLLRTYQHSISELQDRHSAAVVRLEADNALLKEKMRRTMEEKDNVQKQFEILYNDKYLVLKAESATLRRGAEELHSKLAEAGDKLEKLQAVEHRLETALQDAKDVREALDEARRGERAANQRATSAMASLKDLEKTLTEKMNQDVKRAMEAMNAKDEEASVWRKKSEVSAKKLEEAVHMYRTEHAKLERSKTELSRKEDEICASQVRLDEIKDVLSQYKTENQKFYDIKKSLQQRIHDLESENNALKKVAVSKEDENMKLRKLLSEAMDALERDRDGQ